MPPTSVDLERSPRLADRLAAVREGRFIGRLTELDLCRVVLLAAQPLFAVLHVHGPGGIGKSALLREFGLAERGAVPVVSEWPSDGIFLVATAERLARLDVCLRERLLPHRPAGSLVGLAGRRLPGPARPGEEVLDSCAGWPHKTHLEIPVIAPDRVK
jgi:hypothetical protein